MCKDIAYELEVEIIKDYADVRKDVQDVVSVIERGDNYQETVQKVSCKKSITKRQVNSNIFSNSLWNLETIY